MFLRQYAYSRAVVVASLVLVSVMLAPAQTQAQRKDDINSKRYISAIMGRVYDLADRKPGRNKRTE